MTEKEIEEEVYTDQDFGQVLKHLRGAPANELVRAFRKGWNGIEAGIEMYIKLVTHDDRYEPYFTFYHQKKDTLNVWMPSVWDLMAEDWLVYIIKGLDE